MKKIVLSAFLISITSTATHCWEWSDMVPSRLQNWYQEWQIRKQEIQQFKLAGPWHPKWEDISAEFVNEEIGYQQRRKEYISRRLDLYKQAYGSPQGINNLDDQIRRTQKNIEILEKYKDLPQARIRNKYLRQRTGLGWGQE